MLFSKSEEIKNLVGEHGDAVILCFESCEEGIKEIFNGCDDETIKLYVNKLRHLESEADTIRHNIIRTLLEGGLLVDSRKSLMRMIEDVDVIANIAEDIIQEIYIQGMVLPTFTHEAINEMLRLTKEQLILLIKAIKNIVSKYKIDKMTKMISKIEFLESEVDSIQHRVIREVFKSELTLAQKQQVREFINLVGGMSDEIEDISDSIEIIMMARKV